MDYHPVENKFEQVPPGTRVFILGNGPSLAHTPLDLLIGEHTWAVNQIHLIYPKTDWRPTRVTFAEMTAGTPDWFPKIWAAYDSNPQAVLYARDDAWWKKPEHTRLVLFNACTHHDINVEMGWRKIPDAWHFPQVCKFGGSVPMTIQLAVMHGYSQIYLLGCDLGYKPGTSNHFHSDYAINRGIDQTRANKREEVTRMAHELAARVSPVPIYNATPGGRLEAYPRVLFHDLFKE